MPRLPVTIRAASIQDMRGISDIHTHYVLNTVLTFKTQPLALEEQIDVLKEVRSQSLPYLVAISEESKIVGYTYVSGFRHGKGGYRHTVELSLFCHPDSLCRGVGSALLSRVLEVLSKPEGNRAFVVGTRDENSRVRQVIACMAVDTDGQDGGLGLKKYYEGFGFVPSGHLKQVGLKLDRW